MTRFFIFAGEASGDLHGSHLIKALSHHTEKASFCGVGGPFLRLENFECVDPMENYQVMGFSDVFRRLPLLITKFNKIKNYLLKSHPDCVILIDYPGFNLRLARSLRKQGFKGKIVQYICPSVWAHGKKRIEVLEKNFDLLLTIFPFESDYFSKTSLKVEYVGNPLVDTLSTHHYQTDWKTQIGLPSNKKLIALFPGSRLSEIGHHIPQQLQVAAELKKRHSDLSFALSCAQESLKGNLLRLVQNSPLRLNEELFIIPSCYRYELMQGSFAALAKSGTVALELALHSVPSVIHYKLSALNYFFAKYVLQLNLPHYCMVNILGKRSIFPELMGKRIPSDELTNHLEQMISNQKKREKISIDCQEIKELLGRKSSHQIAAKKILELIR